MKVNAALSTHTDTSTARRVMFWFGGAMAVIGWIYILLASRLFFVNDVQIDGLKSLDPYDVKREVFAILDQEHVPFDWLKRHDLFIDRSNVETVLKERLFADEVTVENISFNVLRLKVEERSNRLVFHSHQQYVWVDLHGVVTTDLSAEEKHDVQAIILGQRPMRSDDPPIIHQDLDELVTAGYHIAEPQMIRQWLEATNQAMKLGFVYREYEPTQTSSTSATFVSQKGYRVIVDMDKELDYQLNAYQYFMKKMPKDLAVQDYIDVRVPGRIYAK